MSSVNDDLAALADPFRAKAQTLIDFLERNGLPFRVFETRRAFSRSTELFMKGRDLRDGVVQVVDKSKVVSNARAGRSPHNWGLAIDCVLITDASHSWWHDCIPPKGPWDTGYDGKVLNRPAVAQAWVVYGRTVRATDLTWGGDFSGFPDKPHAELKQWQTLRPQQWQPIATREVQAGR